MKIFIIFCLLQCIAAIKTYRALQLETEINEIEERQSAFIQYQIRDRIAVSGISVADDKKDEYEILIELKSLICSGQFGKTVNECTVELYLNDLSYEDLHNRYNGEVRFHVIIEVSSEVTKSELTKLYEETWVIEYCLNHGFYNGHSCDCAGTGYHGKNCEIRDACSADSDCENGGTCGNKECKCTAGWEGETCQTSKCSPVCENGTCNDDGICDCNAGYFGDQCENEILCTDDSDCENGQCTNSVCICNEGWHGPVCEISLCDPPCENGSCKHDKTCDCTDTGYHGAQCEKPIICEEDAVCEHGVCNLEELSCICDAGWEGETCSVNKCDPPCENGGTCTDEGTCDCAVGYFGDACEKPKSCVNDFECLNSGICDPDVFKCDCTDGWTGKNCELPVVRSDYTTTGDDIDPILCNGVPCINGNCENVEDSDTFEADSDEECLCEKGFGGDHCEYVVCPESNPCESVIERKDMDEDEDELDPTCICAKGYKGKTGQFITCDELDCGEGTVCVVTDEEQDDLCECVVGWCENEGTCTVTDETIAQCDCDGTKYHGDNCEVKDCAVEEDCNSNGVCEDKVCSCNEGYAGTFCETRLCDDDCGNGICVEFIETDEQECKCESGFRGDRCQYIDCIDALCINGKCTNPDDDDGVCECDLDCVNGVCAEIKPDLFYCNCYSGFNGELCQYESCDHESVRCYEGSNCVNDENSGHICECEDDYCDNQATCTANESSISCDCKVGFGGALCEFINCDSTTIDCRLNGKCEGGEIENASCNCSSGYHGDRCQYQSCVEDECINGSCDNTDDDHGVCNCIDGFSGVNCAYKSCFSEEDDCPSGLECVDRDEEDYYCKCTDSYCNNGKCDIEELDPTCICAVGYKGKTCQLISCDQWDCGEGTECVDTNEDKNDLCECVDDWCRNDGTCLVEDETHAQCECDGIGYHGDNCEVKDCADEKDCNLNGVCNNKVCDCHEGYEGNYCDSILCDEYCGNGICLKYIKTGEQKCDCDSGFHGDRCEYQSCLDEECKNGDCDNTADAHGVCNCFDGFMGFNCEYTYCFRGTHDCPSGLVCVDGVEDDYYCKCTDAYCNDGKCDTEELDPTCICDIGYKGETCQYITCDQLACGAGAKCEENGDDHASCECNLTCQNGECKETDGNSFFCDCPEEFRGDLCQYMTCSNPDVNCGFGTECREGDQDRHAYCVCEEGFCNDGTCEIMNNEAECECNHGFTGDFCDIMACSHESAKCHPDAICVDANGGYICECTENYCKNDAVCSADENSIHCECKFGYMGILCEKVSCDLMDCGDHGICHQGTGEGECYCKDGYTGNVCQFPPDTIVKCDPECKNGGKCIEGTDQNVCDCTGTDYSGDICTIPICEKNYCKNGGECSVENREPVCSCDGTGYVGKTCTDNCVSNADCNNGTCDKNSEGILECNCDEDFHGKQCQYQNCRDDFCGNNGICIEQDDGQNTCNCLTTGFHGANCELNDCDACASITESDCIVNDNIVNDARCVCQFPQDSVNCFKPRVLEISTHDSKYIWVCDEECKKEGFWYIAAIVCGVGVIIFTSLISIACSNKCSYYFNLTFNLILLIFLIAVSLALGIMDYLNWAIVGGTLGGLGALLIVLVTIVCMCCTDKDDDDYDDGYMIEKYPSSKRKVGPMNSSSERPQNPYADTFMK